MIERLLAADDALQREDLETAERLFGQVAEADPRNAIAAVGLGRVAAGRDDAQAARTWFVRALEIDPDEAAAKRLLMALERELATAGAAEQPRPTESTPVPQAPRVNRPPAARRSTAPRPRSLVDRIRRSLGLDGRRS